MEGPHTSEVSVVLPSLNADPWMRFDLWAERAWGASQNAVDIAIASGESAFEPAMDSRVIALMNAAQVAKDFAAMTNPRFAASSGAPQSRDEAHCCDANELMHIWMDDEDG